MKCFVCFLIICFVCVFCIISCDTRNNPNITSSTSEKPVDMSSFQGTPNIEATVDIEERAQSSYCDCIVSIKNNTGKSIEKITLYLVKCFDYKSPIESQQYSERLSLENIDNEETKQGRWFFENHNANHIEYRVYLAYISYTDGTTWGVERANHKAIITRDLQVNVCTLDAMTPTTKQTFEISYSANIISNSHVGNNWSYGLKHNDTFVYTCSTITIDVAEKFGPRFKIYAIENDGDDDYGSETMRFPPLEIGDTISLTQQVIITENGGRYTGHTACMQFVVTITRIN